MAKWSKLEEKGHDDQQKICTYTTWVYMTARTSSIDGNFIFEETFSAYQLPLILRITIICTYTHGIVDP